MHNNEADGETSRVINQMQRVDKDDGKSSGKDIQDASIGIGETLQESNRDDASMDALDDSKITLPWAFIDCDIDHLVILVGKSLGVSMILTPIRYCPFSTHLMEFALNETHADIVAACLLSRSTCACVPTHDMQLTC